MTLLFLVCIFAIVIKNLNETSKKKICNDNQVQSLYGDDINATSVSKTI